MTLDISPILVISTTILAITLARMLYLRNSGHMWKQNIFYTIQRARYGYSKLPESLEAWGFTLSDDREVMLAEMRATVNNRESLRSFFRQKGYTLYYADKAINQ